MAANYNRPKPVDPIAYRKGCYINIRCGCGRSVCEPLGPFAQTRGVSEKTTLYELIKRLRCWRCHQRPAHVDVTRYRGSN